MISHRVVATTLTLCVALMVVMAAPASASHTVTVANSTDDTEFNSGTHQYTTVSGSGESAVVVFAGGRSVTGWESGTLTISDSEFSHVSGTGSVESAPALTGSQSLTLTNGDFPEYQRSTPSPRDYSWQVNVTDCDGMQNTNVDFEASNGNILSVGLYDQGTGVNWRLIEYDGSNFEGENFGTLPQCTDGQIYNVTADIDHDGDSITLFVDGQSETINYAGGGADADIPDTEFVRFEHLGGSVSHYDEWGESVSEESYTSRNYSSVSADTAVVDLTTVDDDASVRATTEAWNGTAWVELANETYTSAGNKSLPIAASSYTKFRNTVRVTRLGGDSGDAPYVELDGDYLTYRHNEPVPAEFSPPDENTQNTPVELSVDIDDDDFGYGTGDTVTVDFILDGTVVNTQMVSSSQTVTHSVSSVSTVDHEWNVTLTDSYGAEVTTVNRSFQTPGNLSIAKENDPETLINDREITVQIIGDDDITERSTTNGNVSLQNIPTSDEYVLVINTTGYTNRTLALNDIGGNKRAYLINTSQYNTFETRFVGDDRTGKFPSDSSEVLVQRVLNRSGTSDWETVASDEFGAAGYTVDLQEEIRYRVIVRNDDGDERVLGAYVPRTAGTVTLEIGSVLLDPADDDSPSYAANRTNETGAPVRIGFEYNDSTEETNQLYITMYEYNDESNILLANSSFTGPYGTFALTQDVPSTDNKTTWVVKFTAIKSDGSQIQGSQIVGPTSPILPDLPEWLVTIFFVGTMLTVAGLFSKLNGAIGGIVIAALAAILWFIGLTPPTLGVGVIVLALIIAAVIFLNEFRGTGL